MAASDLPLSADDRATLSMRSDEFHVAPIKFIRSNESILKSLKPR